MRVMMLCAYPLDPSEITGGVAAAAYNLVNALVKYTDISVAVFGFWTATGKREEVTMEQGRVNVIRYPSPGRFSHTLGFSSQKRAFAKEAQRIRPSIIHAQGEGLYASLAVGSRYPNVYTIHGIRLKELEMVKPGIGSLRYRLRSRLIRDHHRRASNIVAINEYTKREIEGLHEGRVWTIHNAIDEHFFDLYGTDDPDVGNILLVGGLRRRKDILTCLRAIAHVQDCGCKVQLNIVGLNDKDYEQEVHRTIDEHELRSIVKLHGLVAEEPLDQLYRRADVVVLSSVEESSPISIAQGIAAGKPIVSTDVGGIAEMVESGVNGFLVGVGDWLEMGKRLRQLIEDRELRTRFSRESHRIALRDWSAESTALKTYRMYEAIVAGK